ncbi:MAG: UDP-glucose--hexose-1-phosphate uridylyltransferase [Atopobiaceae bacterium]|nr:UDP-glucose--hexose-1-phosphate uridylyltransferase [Atopobiaceae bacterium]
MAITQSAAALVAYAARCAIISPDDRTWAFNRILGALRQSGSTPLWDAVDVEEFDLEAVMNRLSAAGVEAGVDEDTPSGRDRIETELMGLLMARPSTINERFHALMRTEGPQAATDWFYRLCCDARYVREAAIARNMSWRTSTAWGDLEITINLSKPEKDPASIAAEGKALVGAQYPACQLCVENEGYYGRGARSPLGPHPARQNLRVVPIELGGETWGFQYSPYAYFEEHCITMSAEHRPMAINRANMGRLLDFIDLLPHYFVGSNADLPIVGGSILSHDHFQGGRHEFPMMRAEVERTVSLPGFEGVTCVSLRWPLSVLRLRSTDRKELLDAACHIAQAWRSWNDQAAGVLAYDQNGTPHNTVTPIARRCGEEYELYLALRCNVTSAEHPLGVFHPHEDKWHIKKENIGLIEVMGMAILPPRLNEAIYDGALTRDEVGRTFAGVLEDAGVFKWDEDGRAALGRFLECL